MRLNTILVVAFALAALIAVSVVTVLSLMFRPNTRLFEVDVESITLRGRLDSREFRYSFAQIGNETMPYTQDLDLRVRCEGIEVIVDQFKTTSTPDLAERSFEANTDYDRPWPLGARRIVFFSGRLSLVLASDRILQVRLTDHAEGPPMYVRTARSKDWKEFPLTETDARMLFGEPSTVADAFLH